MERRVLEHGFTGEAGTIQELLSYPVARILVSCAADEHLVRWYAHGEAVLAHSRLAGEPGGALLEIASELDLRAREGGSGELTLHFSEYLPNATAIKAPEWKLVNRVVDRGRVPISRAELARLCLEALRARIGSELPLPVPAELVTGFSRELETISEALRERKALIETEAMGPVSITKMPPCMKHLLAQSQGGINIPHLGRFAIATFLHHLGMNSEGILQVFSAAPDFSADKARYQIEHITGEGSGTEYTPPECDTMKTNGLCHEPDRLCSREWMNHPLTYYRVKDRDEKKKGRGGARNGGDLRTAGRTPERARGDECHCEGPGSPRGAGARDRTPPAPRPGPPPPRRWPSDPTVGEGPPPFPRHPDSDGRRESVPPGRR